MRSLSLITLLTCVFLFSCKPTEIDLECDAPIQTGMLSGKICGMSLVAPADPYQSDPMAEMSAINIDWVALLPYGFFDESNASITYPGNTNSSWWWGESKEGISAGKNLADAQNMKIMLKPQLWSWTGWIGDVNFQTQADWDKFHVDYTNFICYWAHVADSLQVDMFCVGTEVKYSAIDHPNYWKNLIDTIKTIYSGPLTYAPNWDEYDQITFWDQLDYIGCDAYFSLVPDKTPKVCDLKTAWEPTLNKLKAFSEQWNKPILFTEWGYLTLDGCAYQTWELEKDRDAAELNQQAQANASQALLELFGKETWWAGGFQWKWYADLDNSSWDRSNDYTPQGKICEDVIKQLYQP